MSVGQSDGIYRIVVYRTVLFVYSPRDSEEYREPYEQQTFSQPVFARGPVDVSAREANGISFPTADDWVWYWGPDRLPHESPIYSDSVPSWDLVRVTSNGRRWPRGQGTLTTDDLLYPSYSSDSSDWTRWEDGDANFTFPNGSFWYDDGGRVSGSFQSYISIRWSISLVAWDNSNNPPPPLDFEGGAGGGAPPPLSPICPPCDDVDCLAPENLETLEQIQEGIGQYGQGCTAPDNSSLIQQVLTKIQQLDQAAQPYRDFAKRLDDTQASLTGFGEAQSTYNTVIEIRLANLGRDLQTELNTLIQGLQQLNFNLALALAEGIIGTLFSEPQSTADDIFSLMDEGQTLQFSTAYTCDAATPTNHYAEGARLTVLAQGMEKLGEAMNPASCLTDEFNPVAVWPEWWGTRPGASVPQVVAVFAEKTLDGKWLKGRYPVVIPHTNRVPPIQSFWKGPAYGRLTLSNNSKLIVNCRSVGEAKKVINLLKSGISILARRGATESYGETQTSISSAKVHLFAAFYFPEGQRSNIPIQIK